MRPLRRTGPIARANRWYDRQPEPQRFLWFLFGVLAPIALLWAFAPLLAALLVVVLGLPRAWWLTRGGRLP